MAIFKFTPEQLKAIYDGDMDARNTFYFDNLDIIQRMAYCAVLREQHPTVTQEDLVQGVYADMDYFCHSVNRPVTNTEEIRYFLRWSFHLAPYGGLAYCREHNPKITCACGSYYNTEYTDNNPLRLDAEIDDSNKHLQGDRETTYAEYIPDPRAEQALESATDYTDEYVNTFGVYLTPKQRDVFALMMDGYSPSTIAEKLNQSLTTTLSQRKRMREVFRKHLADILPILESYGIHAEKTADTEPPKRFYKTSAKQRERMRAYWLRKGAETRKRRKAQHNGNDVA